MPEPDDILEMVKDMKERTELEIQFRIALINFGQVDLVRLIALLDKAIDKQEVENAPHPYMVEEGWDNLWKMRDLAKTSLEFQKLAVEAQKGLTPRPFNRAEFRR